MVTLFVQKATTTEAEDEDEQCRAANCVVRRRKKAGVYDWAECEHCKDWYHIVCTDIDKNISQEQLEELTWYCHFCSQQSD